MYKYDLYKANAGQYIGDFIEELLGSLPKPSHKLVAYLEFNGTIVPVYENSTKESLLTAWHKERGH